MTDGDGNGYCSGQNDTRQLSSCTYLFEAFSCTSLHPDPKSWCLDRLEEVPSFLGGLDLPDIPSKTAPIEEKEFRNMCRWVNQCFD